MKKVILLLVLSVMTNLGASGQNDEAVICYGIDYTEAKVYGAAESVEQFAQAFVGINKLLLTEREKYDMSYITGTSVTVELQPILSKFDEADYEGLLVNNTSNVVVPELDYAAIVAGYDIEQTYGRGLVLIAKVLDKYSAEATYQIVEFDIATMAVLSSREYTGKARGFGLRNYWAGSVYDIIKDFAYDKSRYFSKKNR